MSVTKPIYMDYNASTPVDGRVLAAMGPYFTEIYGNPSSTGHQFGNAALSGVANARNQVAVLLNVEQDQRQGAREIIWTSGATESNNLAIKGVAASYAQKGHHIITQATEHRAVLEPCQRLTHEGFELTVLPVDERGRVKVDDVAAAIRPHTILVSIMYANNETGTIQPIREIGELCKSRGVFFHTDATQAIGKLRIDVQADGIDLLSLSGHKFYGPKGCGALFVRRKGPHVRIAPLLDGGGHERGYRSGTLNVPGIVGLGAACEILRECLTEEPARIEALRDRLERTILSSLDGVFLNGDPVHRLPQVTNLSFADIEGSQMIEAMNDIAVSSGSACNSAGMFSSHVLRAMGVSEALAFNSIRFSLGRYSSAQQVEYVANKVIRVVRELRSAGAPAFRSTCA